MLNKALVTTLILSQFVFSCAKPGSDDPAVAANPPIRVNKPLPSDCSSPVTYLARWKPDHETEKYKVSIGYSPGDYFEDHELNGTEDHFSRDFNRDEITYYIRFEKHNGFYSTHFDDKVLYVPSCANRADWDATHPGYYEPLTFTVNWK
ncbi:MAG: hypothetical protein AABY64_12080 [Bdellovibrionota bacterium]